MIKQFTPFSHTPAIPIISIVQANFDHWVSTQPMAVQTWLRNNQFSAKPGTVCLLSNESGGIATVFLGRADQDDFWSFGALPNVLPVGIYQIDGALSAVLEQRAYMAWGLGCYQFKAYKTQLAPIAAQLMLPEQYDIAWLDAMLQATYLLRDLINTPAEDLGPAELAQAAMNIAEQFDARIEQTVGDELLQQNYPAIHAVGRASVHPPRLIDLSWGNPEHPKLTLVGKGVCFDTGGLDIKSAAGMISMKKDMGGAAHVLALSYLIMSVKLPVRLRLLIPAVENSISGNAYRPSDIIKTRKGISVEVMNTDAEGRLILCDALAEAASESPDLLIDFATLTGAARVALGTDIVALFSNDDEAARAIMTEGEQAQDPVWQMPLYQPYQDLLKRPHADIGSLYLGYPWGGAINAALFLEEFIVGAKSWMHFDLMAENMKSRPGRPEGGEAQGVRAVFGYLQKRYIKAA